MTDWPLFDDRADPEAVLEALAAAGLGDGLPVLPPTAARLAAMLADATEPDAPLALLPPMFGEITPRRVAWCCVAAGCLPGVRTLVETALVAATEPELNLLGLATTTGSAALATIVHGPAAEVLGLNSGLNCLGPGNRANATIGRAISLALRHIGGAIPGEGDMATCGQPAKYTFCFAEAGGGPFPPLHVRRGLATGTSAVTVFGISGTAEVLPLRDSEGGDAGAEGILEALASIMIAATATTGAARQPEATEQVFVLPPELAERLALAGIGLAGMQSRLAAAITAAGAGPPLAPEHVQPVLAGGPGVKMAYLPLWGGGTRLVTRALAS